MEIIRKTTLLVHVVSPFPLNIPLNLANIIAEAKVNVKSNFKFKDGSMLRPEN